MYQFLEKEGLRKRYFLSSKSLEYGHKRFKIPMDHESGKVLAKLTTRMEIL